MYHKTNDIIPINHTCFSVGGVKKWVFFCRKRDRALLIFKLAEALSAIQIVMTRSNWWVKTSQGTNMLNVSGLNSVSVIMSGRRKKEQRKMNKMICGIK